MSIKLVDYSSDEEIDVIKTPEKGTSEIELLPVPAAIQEMYFRNASDNNTDDPSKHGGKIRCFPHERGVWATYVYVDYIPSAKFCAMVEELKNVSRNHNIQLEIHNTFHISLSRTVKLRHHFIEPFVGALKTNLNPLYRFQLKFDSIEVYENEERTRTFLGLKVHLGQERLMKLVKEVDLCLADFQLPCFYANPSFHLSCASCIGSKSQIIESFLAELNVAFQLCVESDPTFRTMWVSEINCRSGNKLFTTSLKT